MIGLDTNVVLRYILQDDTAQSSVANTIIERLTMANPGYISLATTLEIVWVLRSIVKLPPRRICEELQLLLGAKTLVFQNEQQVLKAVFTLKGDLGEFEDALIGALNEWAGCSQTYTFDRGTSRIPHFRILA
jgi:predicted nucleic-acid-binding protein